tara:strand:+ start:836 stop:1255 length:420 start_codon:yes stop_codon:yes gene_type:complete
MKKTWELKKKVLPQNTDYAGVLWHGEYVNWMEEARIRAFESSNMPYKDIVAMGFDFPVISLQINYLKALFLGEEVIIRTSCCKKKGLRWPWRTMIFNEESLLAAEAYVEIILVKRTLDSFKIMRGMPAEIKEYMIFLEK